MATDDGAEASREHITERCQEVSSLNRSSKDICLILQIALCIIIIVARIGDAARFQQHWHYLIVDGDLIARRMSQPYHTDLSIVSEDSEVMPLGASHRYILIAFYYGTCEDFAAFPVLLSDFARYEITVMLLQRTPPSQKFLGGFKRVRHSETLFF